MLGGSIVGSHPMQVDGLPTRQSPFAQVLKDARAIAPAAYRLKVGYAVTAPAIKRLNVIFRSPTAKKISVRNAAEQAPTENVVKRFPFYFRMGSLEASGCQAVLTLSRIRITRHTFHSKRFRHNSRPHKIEVSAGNGLGNVARGC
jgi:hypothetical protein